MLYNKSEGAINYSLSLPIATPDDLADCLSSLVVLNAIHYAILRNVVHMYAFVEHIRMYVSHTVCE